MSDHTNAGRELLVRIASDLGLDREIARTIPDPVHPVPLPSRLAVGALAWASVTAASLAYGREGSHLHSPDPDRIAMAYRSDRILRIDGRPPTVWSPYSGFWAASDGWVRTHGNYPHHARAFRSALEVSAKAGPDEIRTLFAGSAVGTGVERITRGGVLAVAVKAEDREHDAALRSRPLLEVGRIGEAAPRTREVRPSVKTPLDGIRVLDLTRVIAGPVCTRTLALLGADVLRIDPPHLPEIDWQHLDTGHGKRSALLDATSTQMTGLLESADVVVLGYRPAALARLGLSPQHLARRYPGLVIAQLSAWGLDQPDRAGFDSLVQAESGIALVESPDGGRPGVLPAQALDHSAGYLLAASVSRAIARQAQEGGTWYVSTSLRRIAAELLGMPRLHDPEPEREIDVTDHTQQFDVSGQAVTTARAALPGLAFAPPRTWAGDAPSW